MLNENKNEIKTDPTKLDNVSDKKYPADFREKTEELMASGLAGHRENPPELSSEITGRDDSPPLEGQRQPSDEDLLNSDLSSQELDDLKNAASRNPETDDFLDQDFLDETDGDQEPLNEQNDFMGEELDIDEDEADANLYDDNE